MDPLLLFGGLGGLGYGAYWLGRKACGVVRAACREAGAQAAARAAAARALAARRQRERERLRRLNALARQLQLALLRLDRAPDYRRAASWAARAREVPAAFRQRQFRRFRPRLVRHFAARLEAGGDPAVLSRSLTELLGHLGVAAFEADYIRAEAERRYAAASAAPPAPPPSYAQRLAQLQREHAERLAALERLPELPPETRERLLEAEETRFHQALEQLADGPPTG